ncbi:MAG: tRNA (N6-isopentenyl adenosine(37)-C2)-methylthiotransferase MiaB [Alphaproteobacteria bacterium]|nr:tRNA (N6-isopentenyl adenosine(37)-C2)-methylthiotransferase MiaB [Alphaproteobacteria bacterium]
MAKKLHIKTYGCQMNAYDSARMYDVLAPLGYEPTDTPDGADMVILNTCHIREKAAEKVFSELGRLKRLKADGQPMILAVGGCVAQAEGDHILKRAPQVDLVFGPQSYHRLPELVARAERQRGQGVLDIDILPEPKFDQLPESGARGPAAFIAIQEGCDRFCTYCVVPYTRGAEYCRPAADILAEAGHLAASGTRELTLLGQNVNAWQQGGLGLGRLIRQVAAIPGIERVRYTTSHPAHVDEELIEAHANEAKLMPYLHLPVQSGSDKILKAMNRGHDADDYRLLAHRLKSARSDLALSSDFIVGFPGESEADFQATLDLIDEVGFVLAYSFKFSPRPGTGAAVMDGQVPEEVKTERLARLQTKLEAIQANWYQTMVGRDMDVLFDRVGRHKGQLLGRSPFMQPVHVKAPESLMGGLAKVRILESHANSLAGMLVAA